MIAKVFNEKMAEENLKFLLKKISLLEEICVNDLLKLIVKNKQSEMNVALAIATFCANYYSQAATRNGHEMANHGRGYHSIAAVFKTITSYNQNYAYALIIENNFKLTEDIATYNYK